MDFIYDIIVIGAGHAGNEAACAAANMGSKTLLITMDMNKMGQMSCNPAVGGIAKGQIVREIDALGGQMGIVTDRSAIQFRMLNRSKGPAMWSPRSQSDRIMYIQEWTKIISNTPNLYIWQDTVSNFIVDGNTISGVKTSLGVDIKAKAVILTAGTFLSGLLHIGSKQLAGGRISEPASYGLTEQLKELGFKTDRMKTGTPCRIDGRSIDFTKMTEQPGDNDFHQFSFLDGVKRELKQMSCWITYTNEKTHAILSEGLEYSPLYNGQIQSIGPRYCPSIETKIITFSDKNSHQLFLEPEGVDSQEYYVNGFSSSLPLDVQIRAIQTVPGLEKAQLYRPGYAIEYDFFDPTQLQHTLETKLINNLYFAGQVNGTTGYEEAGGQGLMAGINAHSKINGKDPFILARNEAYIGVLIDDLVTKGVDEPYRMFTSRAEYRLLLRQDDADMRLTSKGYEIGLAKSERVNQLNYKKEKINVLIDFLKHYSIKPQHIKDFLISKNSSELKHGCKLYDLILRPQIGINDLMQVIPDLNTLLSTFPVRTDEIIEASEIIIKYDGYIQREKIIANKIERLENIQIKNKINYKTIKSLSTEARQKLEKINPETIGQASRIPGISPSDINVLLVLLGR
jgi:tRNA uridine 5-carboxymethylaminomethyl modification enzyme